MKYIIAIAFFTMVTFCASAQTAMTVHLNSGSTQTFLLADIDSITYGTGATGSYTIGSTGPGGGIVFYDKGTVSNGWRYLEVYNSFLNTAAWGCNGTSITGNSDAIGKGYENTQLIVNACSTPGIAAKICNNHSVVVNGVTIDDWFLPSIEEVNQIYINEQNIPVVKNSGPDVVSSTESDSTSYFFIDFISGSYSINSKNNPLPILAIRRF